MRKILLSLLVLCFMGCGEQDVPRIEDNLQQSDTPNTPEEDEEEISDSDNDLNVTTWNIEWFPKNNTTITSVRSIIEDLETDIIAVQEINEISTFNLAIDGITGWESEVADVNGDLNIGYAWKESSFTAVSSLTETFPNDSYSFPREMVRIDLTHASGREITLLNIHLKCCSNGEDRRESASEKMYEYIEENLKDRSVILLGDFNDDISENTPFKNFIDDPEYRFADANIANSSSSEWSYPSYPSHIDHILISNELFDNMTDSETIKLHSTFSNYTYNVSDHNPVTATFNF